MSTDYNDGKWWGWNGGECPVHPESEIYGVEPRGIFWTTEAKNLCWKSFRGAFRVTKEHKEPREFWLVPETAGYSSKVWTENPYTTRWHGEEIVHVREVLE